MRNLGFGTNSQFGRNSSRTGGSNWGVPSSADDDEERSAGLGAMLEGEGYQRQESFVDGPSLDNPNNRSSVDSLRSSTEGLSPTDAGPAASFGYSMVPERSLSGVPENGEDPSSSPPKNKNNSQPLGVLDLPSASKNGGLAPLSPSGRGRAESKDEDFGVDVMGDRGADDLLNKFTHVRSTFFSHTDLDQSGLQSTVSGTATKYLTEVFGDSFNEVEGAVGVKAPSKLAHIASDKELGGHLPGTTPRTEGELPGSHHGSQDRLPELAGQGNGTPSCSAKAAAAVAGSEERTPAQASTGEEGTSGEDIKVEPSLAKSPSLVKMGSKKNWGKLQDRVNADVELKQEFASHKTLFGRLVADEDTDNIFSLVARLKQSRWVLLEDSPLRVKWDLAQFFVLVYLAIAVPFRIGFSIDSEGIDYIVELAIEVYFYVDIFLNFITAFEDDSMTVQTKLSAIARNYLTGWFTIDVISILPIDLAIRITEGRFICSFYLEGCAGGASTNQAGQYVKLVKMVRLVRLVKLLRLFKMGRIMEKYKDEFFAILRYIACVKLIVVLVYLGHIFGCIFYFFSSEDWMTDWEQEQREQGLLVPWLYAMYGDDPSQAPLEARYMSTLYWSFTTMTTVGYGDIGAVTVAERGFAILGMIIGGFMLSAIVGKLVGIMEEANMRNKARSRKMLSAEEYVKDLKIEKRIRIQLLSFFRKQVVKPYDERALLMELPFELRSLVLQHLYKRLIDTVPFFTEGDNVFRTELCTCLQPVNLLKGGVVYQHGEIGREMYIVSKGEIEVLDWRSGKAVAVLKAGSYVGEGAVLGEPRRKETLRARTPVQLLSIGAKDLEALLVAYPAIRVKLHGIYQKRRKVYHAPENPEAKGQLVPTHSSLLYNAKEVDRVNQLEHARATRGSQSSARRPSVSASSAPPASSSEGKDKQPAGAAPPSSSLAPVSDKTLAVILERMEGLARGQQELYAYIHEQTTLLVNKIDNVASKIPEPSVGIMSDGTAGNMVFGGDDD